MPCVHVCVCVCVCVFIRCDHIIRVSHFIRPCIETTLLTLLIRMSINVGDVCPQNSYVDAKCPESRNAVMVSGCESVCPNPSLSLEYVVV